MLAAHPKPFVQSCWLMYPIECIGQPRHPRQSTVTVELTHSYACLLSCRSAAIGVANYHPPIGSSSSSSFRGLLRVEKMPWAGTSL